MYKAEDIILIHCQRKDMRIKAIAGGRLEIRAPYGTPMEDALNTVNTQQDKIRKLQVWYEQKHQSRSYSEGSSVLRMGEEMKLSFVKDAPYTWRYQDQTLYIKQRYSALVVPVLRDFYTEQAQYLILRARQLQHIHGFPPVKLSKRWNKSRWGSCSSKGRISLNCALVMAPLPVIDYVIIHEYCHLRHPNHSSDFWLLVEHYIPDYRVHYRWLKENGYRLRIAEQRA